MADSDFGNAPIAAFHFDLCNHKRHKLESQEAQAFFLVLLCFFVAQFGDKRIAR
jgi:hypothetical protein